MFADIIKIEYYVYAVEGLTVLAVLAVLGYFFYSLNIFKKD